MSKVCPTRYNLVMSRVLLEFQRCSRRSRTQLTYATRTGRRVVAAAMSEAAAALQLEYIGLDCTIDRAGNVLVFEADPAMIVHAADDPAMFGYKHAAAHAIFAAFAALVDRARSL